MKSFFRKLKTNIRPIMQVLSLLLVGIMPSLLNVVNIVAEQPKLTASQNWIDYFFNFVWTKGNIAIGLFFVVSVMIAIRKMNKGYMFNKGVEYKNYPYIWYWICAKILGYTQCNLVLVPIYMQFKLVIRDVFNDYYCGNLSNKDDDTISVDRTNMNNVADEVNLIISDTYPINHEQIPILKRMKPTIFLSRDNDLDSNRYFSKELIKTVVNEVRNLPPSLRKVNIFATTNPQNTMHIVQDAFKLGERGNIELITVFKQNKNGLRSFKEKGVVVYKR